MLPLFQIVTCSRGQRNMSEGPPKPRRKKIDVPVHRAIQEINNDHNKIKTFSGNFHSSKYCKNQDITSKAIIKDEDPIHTEIILETVEPNTGSKLSRRHLVKENYRLLEENRELNSRFNELEGLSVNKITKLREKVNLLQLANSHFKKDIEELEENYEQVLYENNALKIELEKLKICKKCEEYRNEIAKCNSDNEKVLNENEILKAKRKEFTEDLAMLKTVVYRLNLQLERYQELLRTNNIPKPGVESYHKRDVLESSSSKEILSEVHRDHKHIPVIWGNVNRHTLGPLLDAYEDSVKEKDEIIEEYEIEMSKFTGKVKEIIEENESLYKKLNEDETCSSKLAIELENSKRELKNTREQNDALIKKCSLKQDKLEEVLKIYEAKVEQMSRDFDVLHGEYVKSRTENAALKEKNKSCIESQAELKNQMHNFIPISVHNSSVNECKKWYEELKIQYEQEKEKLLKSIETHNKTIEDLNKEIASNAVTKQKLENSVSHLEKHVKKLEAKQLELEHNLNGVHLSRTALKKQLHKAMEFAKEMVAEQEQLLKALNLRQQENKVVRKLGSDMATKMDMLRNQLKDVQKNAWQEFATVEQTIQDQAQTIEVMKDQYEKEIEDLRKVVAKYEEVKDNNIVLRPENLQMAHYFLLKNKYK
ncbi:centrosomal protein of 89 kDa-like isoform X1 [Diabrotica undecimpunctata]|uniref:centrosomal protein of 89 kDa-like isoform X1 n=2 Tax=Diabrotica undecimpunctata TaxID=50387 RepID=UPI003B63DA96